jgi:hypothetical protein
LELFYDRQLSYTQLPYTTSGLGIGSTLYEILSSGAASGAATQHGMSAGPGAFASPPPPPGFMGSVSGGGMSSGVGSTGSYVVPFTSLSSLGMHNDVVTRLRELQQYLNQVYTL